MKININYPQLSAEFVIVFVGVAVALAADNWREDFSDRRIERDYLVRIKNDLETGQNQLGGYSSTYSNAFDSTGVLIDYLEGNSGLVDESLLVEHFTKATRTGGPVPGAGISHNGIYLELISTGRLSLISNPDLRVAISNYYREMGVVTANLGALPTDIWARFRELTGQEAGLYLSAGELPVGEAASRLVEELDNNDQRLVRELRLLHSRLNLHTGSLEDSLAENLHLIEMLDIEIN